MTAEQLRQAAFHWGGYNLNVAECREIADKIDTLTAAVKRAIAVLDDPWSDQRHRTARDLRELLDQIEQSDSVPDRHDVNWGPCPTCGCTDLAFTGWPHGPSQDVLCASCGWSGVFVDGESPQPETPHESG